MLSAAISRLLQNAQLMGSMAEGGAMAEEKRKGGHRATGDREAIGELLPQIAGNTLRPAIRKALGILQGEAISDGRISTPWEG